MVGRLQTATQKPRPDAVPANKAAAEPKPLKSPTSKLAQPMKKAVAEKSDSYTKAPRLAGPKAGDTKRTGSKKADKESFKKAPAAKKNKAGEALGGKASEKSAKGSETGGVSKTIQGLQLSVQSAIGKITGMFSGPANQKQAKEATGIIKSFQKGDLDSLMSGIGGKPLQGLLRESPSSNRKGLLDHVTGHGGKPSLDALGQGIQNEMNRIRKEGIDWIKHPAPDRRDHGSNDGPGKDGGIFGNRRREHELHYRDREYSRLMKCSTRLTGDKGSGPIG